MMKRFVLLTFLASSSVLAESNQRTFEFTYVAELDVPEGSERVQMWLPYPGSADYQNVRLLGIESPVPTKIYQEYTYRNSMLFLSTPAADIDTLRIEMSFRVTRREHAERDFTVLEDPDGWVESRASRWLRTGRTVPLDDVVRARAEEVTAGKTTVVAKAKAIFDYSIEQPDQPGDIKVFIELARAVGIAAKFQIGFSIPTSREEGEIAGYRSWAEFYVPGFGWVPVDTSEAHLNPDKRDYFFGAHDANRIEFTVGRDMTLNPKQSGQPLHFFIYPYAEIDGKPARDLRRQFFYKDLDVAE